MTNRYTNVPKSDNKPENVVIIRGGGDLASGTIHRLYRCGYRLLVLECEKPTAIRRMVSFCEAVYDGQSSVEGVLCRKESWNNQRDGRSNRWSWTGICGR